MLHSSRDALYSKLIGPQQFGVFENFIKWVNFDCILKNVSVKLELISIGFLKAETISNQRLFIRMDPT